LNKSHSDSQAGNNLVHFTHPHSHTISPSLAHAHTHKRTHTHTRVDQSLTRIPATTFCTLMRKVELHGCACTKTHSLSLSLSFSPSLCLSVSLSLSLSHTHTHTHTHRPNSDSYLSNNVSHSAVQGCAAWLCVRQRLDATRPLPPFLQHPRTLS